MAQSKMIYVFTMAPTTVPQPHSQPFDNWEISGGCLKIYSSANVSIFNLANIVSWSVVIEET